MTHASQCDRILTRLQRGPATSWQLGPELGILSLTRRIYELRQAGHDIRWTEQWKGTTRIVTYSLLGERNQTKENSTITSVFASFSLTE